jgi:hypothetical protein
VGRRHGQGRCRSPPERTRAEWTRYIADEHAFWGQKLKTLKIEMD